MNRNEETSIGLISDTHGLLRPQAKAALVGVDVIVHAGDVGKPEILEELKEIAPTVAVRGNVDTAPWASVLPETEVVDAGGRLFYVLHELPALDLNPAVSGFAAVIYGHSHRPAVDTKDGVLYLNPGSAGPRRFKLPVTVARMIVSAAGIRPEIVNLEVS